MALKSSALCTLTQLRDYADIQDSHKDDMLELYINAASDMIDEYLGYDPKTQTYTAEVYDGKGTPYLTLKARPITTLTTVLEDGDTVDIDDFVIRDWYIDGDDYRFIRGHSNYKVTYVAGYSDDDMPADITVTCIKIASLMDLEAGRTGMLSESGESLNNAQQAYEDILNTLHIYRRLDG